MTLNVSGWTYGNSKGGILLKCLYPCRKKFPSSVYCPILSLPPVWSPSVKTVTLIPCAVCLLTYIHFLPLPLSFWYLSICNDSLLAFLVKISHSSVSLQNNVLLARVPESCRVTSCTQERALLCLITVEIMRVEKGFVLPLKTLSAADGAAGIFSCRRCWRADRRAHMCM